MKGIMGTMKKLMVKCRYLVMALTLMTLCPGAMGQSVASESATSQRVHLAQNVSGKVNIEVMVVHASNTHNRVDPSLQPVMQHLRFLSFKGFKMLSKDAKGIGVGQDHTYSVAGGRRVKIKLLERDVKRAKIRIEMYNAKRKILDTTVSVHRNKSFMVAGPKHEGGVLVLPLTARY
jgi:hypothetical protein